MSERTGDVSSQMGWTFFGPRPQRPRANMVGAVLAVMFALPAMTSVPEKYPAYMIPMAVLAAGWFTYLGVRARALMSFLLLPVALIWLNPLFGADWFTHQGPVFFLSHSAFAMLLGTVAYTYTATEKR